MRSRPKALPALTGIRGLAATYVFLTHYQPLVAAFLKEPAVNSNSFMYNGFRGVDLFFVLSGFILMHVHGHDFDELAGPQFRSFYTLRFWRIYPLNTIVLLCLLPIALGMPEFVDWMRVNHGIDPQYHLHEFSLGGFVQTLFLAQTWTVAKLGEWNGPSWTLSAEVVGYGFFPLLAHVLVRQSSAVRCVIYAVASLVSLIALMIAFGHAQNNPTGSFGLVRLIFAFISGMCLCQAYHLWQPQAWPAGTVITLASTAFVVLALSFPVTNILVVIGFAGLIFGLAYREGPVNAFVESRVVMFLGKISFSFYLIHYVILKLCYWLFETHMQQAAIGSRIACLAAVPVLCGVLATAMHEYIERPFQRLGHRLAGRSARTVGATLDNEQSSREAVIPEATSSP